MAYYDYFGDLMKGYQFGSLVKDKMEQNKAKDIEAQYAKQYNTSTPQVDTSKPQVAATSKTPDDSSPFPTTPVTDDKTRVEKTSPFGTYDEKGMESPADSILGFKGQPPTDAERKSMSSGTPMDAEAPKPLTDVVKQSESPKPSSAPTASQETKPIMTQHFEAHNAANDLNNAINYKKGLVQEYRKRGMTDAANKVEGEMFDLQGQAINANIKALELQDKVMDNVGGILDGYIKRAEGGPEAEKSARSVAQLQLNQIGYDGTVAFGDDYKDNIAKAKQLSASTTTGKERTKLQIEATKAAEKERMDNVKIEATQRTTALNERKQAYREKGNDVKGLTSIIKEETDNAKLYKDLAENGTTKEIRQQAYATYLQLQQDIQKDTADLKKISKGKATVEEAPKTAPAKPQQAKVSETDLKKYKDFAKEAIKQGKSKEEVASKYKQLTGLDLDV